MTQTKYEQTVRELKMQLHDARNQQFRAEQRLRQLEQLRMALQTQEDDKDNSEPLGDAEVLQQIRKVVDDLEKITGGSVDHALNPAICRLELIQHTLAHIFRDHSDILLDDTSSLIVDTLTAEVENLQSVMKNQPSRRELRLCQLQNEMLQQELDALKKKQTIPRRSSSSTPPEPAKDAMRRDKLLQKLRVEGHGPSRMLLDVDGQAVELTNDSKTHAGLICIDMVAHFCSQFGISSVAELPSHVKQVQRIARSVPPLFKFVEDVEMIFGITKDSKRENATVSSDRAHKYTSLDKLKQLIAQIVQDYSALEKQLAPSGVAIHVILTQCMRTLNVGQIEDVVPTLLDVLSVMNTLRAFEDDVKLLLGLSKDAPRADVLDVLKRYLDTIGIYKS
ncbi:hypothetical protein AeMF1_009252 [Aphanomyces euteiches]|nr:hypothetical protein AeMF1_009252 [Aphanomyces euteiches]KAH9131575.1 hypothetical protein AeNC1_019560 [Aphanomyces euteiches]